MALLQCTHCRYLFEAKNDTCPACRRRVTDAEPADDRKRTRKFPQVRLPVEDKNKKR